jgi:DNA polymerase-3 subunit epsilon
MPAEAERVHGLSNAFLAGQPVFAAIADELSQFLGDARLIAHNAGFDIGFLNAEFDRLGLPAITFDRVVDTLMLARRRHANSPNSLDALCQRYGIDISHRTLHGGLLDAHLLTEVYIELIGGRQANLALVELTGPAEAGFGRQTPAAPRPVERVVSVSNAELAAHAALIATLGEAPLWRAYLGG